MDLEPLRQAMRTVSPLLRRRGTSPAVGKALRRAPEHLDKALVASDPSAQIAAIGTVMSELRGCVAQIEQSGVPADREQLEGTTRALALLGAVPGLRAESESAASGSGNDVPARVHVPPATPSHSPTFPPAIVAPVAVPPAPRNPPLAARPSWPPLAAPPVAPSWLPPGAPAAPKDPFPPAPPRP